ncbi:hypothetical protein BB561_005580 [Smittium simulii]|uniref:Ste24 endopeptidase n=1 Tax=Smittium simulii TaxID=133385 RepID=A0A2T9Y9P5_9FUNG|nr:hypothetical protein BB561_005580 [Smittium simulii]
MGTAQDPTVSRVELTEEQKHENEALAKIVKTQGFVDDIIDGIYLAVIAISLVLIILFVAISPNLPDFFPAFKVFYRIPAILTALPQTITELPKLAQNAYVHFPTDYAQFSALSATFFALTAQYLTTIDYKSLIICFSWGAYIWDAYLDIRQRDMLHEIYRPAAIRPLVTRKAFLEANAYGLDKSSLKMLQSLVEQIKTTLVLVYDVLPYIWYSTGDFMLARLGLGPEYEITHSIIFFIFTTLLSTITTIPFDLYGTFIVEAKHGFNKQTISLFFSDMLKTLALTFSLGSLVLSGLLWTIKKTGSNFYYYVMVFMMCVQFIGFTIFPTWIQPLFNKFDVLEDGELKTAIEALATRVNYPLKKLYVVDGSKRSGHSNAYMYGFFKNKRIVLFDTLIKQTNTQEVCAILAHELGHWKHNHVLKMLFASQVQIFVIFYMFSLVITQSKMYTDFGFSTMPVFIGFMFYQYLYVPIDTIVTFFFNRLSRKNEFEADAFSKKLGYQEELKQGLIKIHIENKGNLNPDKVYSAYHYSHPPLVERLAALSDPNVAPKSD